MKTVSLLKITALLCLFGPLASWAEIKPAALFSDNMVLQRNLPATVWGTAGKGERITVSFAGQNVAALADADGKWRVKLAAMPASDVAREMVISGPSGRISIQNVIVGEVWVCSGQSNMDFSMQNVTNSAQELAQATNPSIRQFEVAKVTSPIPLDDCAGKWVVSTPQTTVGFTAVGYIFAREVQKTLKVPVGLIKSSWGGTPAQAWTSRAALDADSQFKTLAEHQIEGLLTQQQKQGQYVKDMIAWIAANNRTTDASPQICAAFAAPAAPGTDWKPVTLPAASVGIPGDGVVWVRKEVTIPQEKAGTPLTLTLGPLRDFDTAFYNGTQIGSTQVETFGFENLKRAYPVPAALVKAGKATIAVRIVSQHGKNSVGDTSLNLSGIGLRGEWLFKVEKEFPELSPAAASSRPSPVRTPGTQYIASYVYNGMIHPIAGYGIGGVLWYQGENNWGAESIYYKLFPAMISQWRKDWGQGDFAFLFCQLPGFSTKQKAPGDLVGLPHIREAQSEALNLPNTGQAVLIDVGEEGDIHPRNKQDVGHRLAAVALAKIFGQPIPYSGPVFESMHVEGNKIRVKFTHTDGGLVAREIPATYQPLSYMPKTVPLVRNSPQSPIEGFTISGGANQPWQWADAVIDGDSVLVSSPLVPNPAVVRYAWADNPTCNLYNKAGFPAAPFRSDGPFVKNKP